MTISMAERVENKEIEGLPKETPAAKEELNKILKWLRDSEGSSGETLWRTAAQEDYKFYAGDQDDEEVKILLASQNRPASTYNEIRPKIDMLKGLAAQTDYDIEVIPVGTEDEPLAELMNGVITHFRKKLRLNRIELDCFEHTTKSGRSLLYFYLDNSDPAEPLIRVKRFSGFHFLCDPDSTEPDMSDARFLFLEKWLTEEELKTMDIDPTVLKVGSGINTGDLSFFNAGNDRYRILECWYRKYVMMKWFINPLTGEPEKLTPEDFRKLNGILRNGVPNPQNPQETIQLEIKETLDIYDHQVWYMIFTDQHVIENEISPYGKEFGFPGTLFYGYKDDTNNRWFSAIEMMKDPQRALNTMRRQLSHLIQTLPKGILMHEVGAILDLEKYEENSSSPNYHMELARGTIDKVKFQQQPQISPIYQILDSLMVESIKSASGIVDDLVGIQTSSREPGVSVRLRQQQGMAVLYILYSNFRESRFEATRKLMHLIQMYVTDKQVIRITGQNGIQLMEINSQMNPQVQGFNDISSAKFDLEMNEAAENPTTKMAVAQLLVEFSHNNPGAVPPDIVLDYSNVPFTVKQRIKQAWEAQMIQEQKNKDKEYEIELAKIAATREGNFMKKETAEGKQKETKEKKKEE